MTISHTESYAPAWGLRLWTHRYRPNEGAGRPLLLLHGYMDSAATWERVAAPFADAGFDVFVPDLRGFGRSEWAPIGAYYHFPDYVADVAALVDHLGLEKFVLVGHSMGGTIAALYAALHPARVEKLALLEGLGPLSNDTDIAFERFRRWLSDLKTVEREPRDLGSLENAARRLAVHHPGIALDLLESRAVLLSHRDDRGRLVWSHDPLHRTLSPTPFQARVFNGFLSKIEARTLFVGGGPHGYHPPDEAERLASIQKLQIVDLPRAGHMMHWTEPEALSRAILQFVDQGPD